MTKEQDMRYIKDFAKITISQICRDLKIDRINILNGKASSEKTRLVKEELERRIKELQNG